MSKPLLSVLLVFGLTFHTFFVSAQSQAPAWSRTIQSFPSSVYDPGAGGPYANTPWFTDVKYHNGQVFASGTFNGARARFGTLTAYADTSQLVVHPSPQALDFYTGFVSAADANGNFSWVSTIYAKSQGQTFPFSAPMADVGTVARLAVDPDGSVYATGLVIGDSVCINGQFQYAIPSGVSSSQLIGYLVKFSSTGNVLWSRFWLCSPDVTLTVSSAIPVQLFRNGAGVHVHLYTPGITYNNTTFAFGPNVLRGGIVRFSANGTFQSAGPLPDPFQDGGALALSVYHPRTRNLWVAENFNFNPVMSARHSQLFRYDSLLALERFHKVYTLLGSDTIGIKIASLTEDADGNLIVVAEAQDSFNPDSITLLVDGKRWVMGGNNSEFRVFKFMFRLNRDGCLQWARPIDPQKIHDQGFIQLENGALVGVGTPSYLDNGLVPPGTYPLDSCRVSTYDRNGNQTRDLGRLEFPQTTVRAWNASFFGTPIGYSQMAPAPNGFVAIHGRGLFRYTFSPLPPAGIDAIASISPPGPVDICPGSAVNLVASPGTSYLWSPSGSVAGSTSTNVPGLVSVKIGLPGGCFGYASVQVRNAVPVAVDAGPGAQALINSGTLQLNGLPAGGTWSGNGISASGSFSTALAPGVYPVVYTVTSGACAYRDTTLVTLLPQSTGGVNPPQANLPGGVYPDPIQVSLTSATPGASIYYTTTGNTPKIGAGFTRLYTGPISILQTTTLKSIAVKAGENDSPITVATYTIQNPGIVALPQINPGSGDFSTLQLVSLSTSTPGAAIYYTTNGNLPLLGSPNLFTRLYTGPFPVSRTTTIRAIATKAGLENSPIAVASLSFPVPAETGPVVFSPAPGAYAGPVSLEMSCATSGAVIYYTTNGNVPRTDVPTFFTRIYSTPVALTSSRTVRALAVAPGLAAGQVTAGTYTLGGGFRMATSASDGALEAYPNPTFGHVEIGLPATEGAGTLRVLNLQGREVHREEIAEGTEQVSLRLDGFPAGLYHVEYRHAAGSERLRLVKQ